MEKIIEKIKSANTVAVFPHVNADPDALGSCYAFCEAMRLMGKRAVCYVEEIPQQRFQFIGGEYTLYTGEADVYDLCASLDCGDMERLGSRAEIFNNAHDTINIDHHVTNTLFAQANYVEGDAAATGQILCEFLPKLGIKINDTIARYLYTAICADTGCFKFSNVASKTLRYTADLLEYDFDHAEIARLLFDTDSLSVTKFKAELMGSIESYADGKLSVIELSDELYEKYGIPESEVPNVVDIPRRVEGTEVALCFKPKKDGIGVNFRSNSYVDVSKISIKFGGGGHERAAGCTVHEGTMQQVKRAVIDECIREIYERNNNPK